MRKISQTLLFLFLCSIGKTFAQEIEINGITYQVLNGTEAEITSCRDYDGQLVIPETVTIPGDYEDTPDIYTVTKISSSAFQNCQGITSASLPQSVNYIDEYAFQGCTALKSINIPEAVTEIGANAFKGCIYNHRTTKTNQKYPSVNL